MTDDGFRPVRWLPGRHLETLVPALMRARRGHEQWESRVIPVAPDAAVRVEHLPPRSAARGSLLLVHGMGGCADSRYMWWTAAEAQRRGWIPVRMNARNAGGTEALSRTLYNAGQSDDVGAVLADLEAAGFPRPFAAVGFSLGGNTVLRHAATHGDACGADAVAAISPPVDLEVTCRSLEEPANRIYLIHFTRLLCAQLVRIGRLRPIPGPLLPRRRVGTIRRFDALYTAPDAGHPSVEAYYAHASAGPRLAGLRTRGLILSSRNDPVVPASIFSSLQRGRLRWMLTARGGHLGFWGSGSPRFWAAKAVLDFLEDGGG